MSILEQTTNGTTNCRPRLDKFQEDIWYLFVLQSVLAVAGNGFAIYRFVVGERQWHTGIVYAFNLTVSDLLCAFSLLPIASYYYPPKDWKYGAVFCKLDRFLFFCNLYGSTFFVACISLNRYVAIVHPFFAHGRLEPRHAKLVSGAVWLLVMAISAPVFTFSALENASENNNRMICLGSASRAELPKYWPYSLFLAAFGCGLPFLLTAFSCVAIVCAVIHSHSLTAEEKWKVKTLVGIVVVLYALFYLPFHVLRNLNLHNRMHENLQNRTPKNCNVLVYDFYQMAKILVNFHICIHPLVYAALTDSLRHHCFRCFRWRKEVHEEEKNVEIRLCNKLPSQIPQD
nr:P2Y purinoceptor 11-like [Anolis sagrei ordinatus]